MNDLRLHPEFGVNPTVVQCFFCGEDKNELALLGAGYKGQAPRHMCLNYEPCDECKKKMDMGIALIECAQRPPDNRPAIQEGLYPTGNWMVITEDAARRLFNHDTSKHRKAFVEVGILKRLEELAS